MRCKGWREVNVFADSLSGAGWGGLFEVGDVSRSTNPERIMIITSNGRFFDFPGGSALTLPLPGELMLQAVYNVSERRTVRALYVAELGSDSDGWYVVPKFSVLSEEISTPQLESLHVIDYTGGERKLTVRCVPP